MSTAQKIPMTPQQMREARQEVNLEDVTVILKFEGEEDRNERLDGVWSVFAYAPRLDEPSELVSLFDDDFEDF